MTDAANGGVCALLPQVAGNGYIAAWVAFLASYALAFRMARFMRPAPLANAWLALSHATAHGGHRLNLAGGGGLRLVVAASTVETFQARAFLSMSSQHPNLPSLPVRLWGRGAAGCARGRRAKERRLRGGVWGRGVGVLYNYLN